MLMGQFPLFGRGLGSRSDGWPVWVDGCRIFNGRWPIHYVEYMLLFWAQWSEVRGQKSEIRSQRSEGRSQRWEVRSPMSDVRCPFLSFWAERRISYFGWRVKGGSMQ